MKQQNDPTHSLQIYLRSEIFIKIIINIKKGASTILNPALLARISLHSEASLCIFITDNKIQFEHYGIKLSS